MIEVVPALDSNQIAGFGVPPDIGLLYFVSLPGCGFLELVCASGLLQKTGAVFILPFMIKCAAWTARVDVTTRH